MQSLVVVREENPGLFTAWPAGIPELKVTGSSREDVLRDVSARLSEWNRSGQLATVDLPHSYDFMNRNGRVDPNDPEQILYREALEKLRREDRERSIREIDEIERREAEQQKAG